MTADDTPTVPGVEFHLTKRDATRLVTTLAQLEQACNLAFTNGTEIDYIPKPLYTASVLRSLQEVIERNSRSADVPLTTDSSSVPEMGGGSVDPHKTYTVRHEIGQYNLYDLVPKWTWTTGSETTMTGAQFFAFNIPGETKDQFQIVRSRIHLIDENGKILRERFGYK